MKALFLAPAIAFMETRDSAACTAQCLDLGNRFCLNNYDPQLGYCVYADESPVENSLCSDQLSDPRLQYSLCPSSSMCGNAKVIQLDSNGLL